MFGHWEIILIVLAIVLLFGSRKIPELMRGLGSGVSEFKKGLKEAEKEPEDEAKNDAEK
ncbi:MAG: twin-arginine translocase TatA/TatE family subunit [FCB group bacterium]|nr:twin-arginine translocase TatA/TatE family subunit [FCB group bacterium]